MAPAAIAGKIQTVTGPIEPDQLGVTLFGDMLFHDLGLFRAAPSEASARDQFFGPITQEVLSNQRYYGMRSQQMLRLGNVREAIEEASIFKQWGGETILDGAGLTMGRDPVALARVSRATGLNVIMGGSFYAVRSHPADMDDRTEDDLVKKLVTDIVDGVDGTGIKVGIMGETGLTSPTAPNEIRALRATGLAHLETGCPILIHPGESDELPIEEIELLASLGVDLNHVVMAHVSTMSDDTLMTLLKAGCYVRYEFGGESRAGSPYTITYTGTNENTTRNLQRGAPGDGDQILKIIDLMDKGYADQIVVTSDLNTANRRTVHGGHGYHYLLANIVPRMRASGMDDDAIETLFVRNPQRALTYGT
jgi:phosphotriesterase-related protein